MAHAHRPAVTAAAIEEPSMETMKADEAVRLAALLVEAPNEVVPRAADSPVEREMRKRCAEYWMGTWYCKAKPYTDPKGVPKTADRLVPQNAALLNDDVVKDHYANFHDRRLRELLRHLCYAGLNDDLRRELCAAPTINYYTTAASRDDGELRSMFSPVGGLDGAVEAFLQTITPLRSKLSSMDKKAKSGDFHSSSCSFFISFFI